MSDPNLQPADPYLEWQQKLRLNEPATDEPGQRSLSERLVAMAFGVVGQLISTAVSDEDVVAAQETLHGRFHRELSRHGVKDKEK